MTERDSLEHPTLIYVTLLFKDSGKDSHTIATAPLSIALAINSCPLIETPWIAINKSLELISLESIEILSISKEVEPTTSEILTLYNISFNFFNLIV